MSWLDGLKERLRPLVGRSGLEAELDEELAFHFEREVEANLARGMSPREARRAARARMGGAFRPARDVRAQWRGPDLHRLVQEIKLGLRRLRRRPGPASVAILTLALGIGANTAIFSLVRSVLARPLPYHQPDRLAFIWHPDRDVETWLSPRELLEYRESADRFEGLAGYSDFEVSLTEDAEPARVLAARITANTLGLLGVGPSLGRDFLPEEDEPGASPVAILSHDLWQRRYRGDPGVLGQVLTANGVRATIVGVMPAEFRLPLDYRLENSTELFLPATIDRAAGLPWGNRSYFIFGRLAPDATIETATLDIHAVGARWLRQGLVNETQGDFERDAVRLDDLLLAELRTPLRLLMGAVGIILLIACVNVTHLLLAGAEARRTEVAVAAALGASRRRVVRQQLVENGLLALGGMVLGVGLAAVGLRAALAFTPVGLIRMRGVELDWAVLLFAAVLTAAVTLLAGLAPALRLSRTPLAAAMGGIRGSDAAGGRGGARRWLIAVESAFAVILVIGAALLGRSLTQLNRVDLGFDPANVLTAGITVPSFGYPEAERVNAFYRDLIERVERLPGVESVGAARLLPLHETMGSWTITLEEPLPPPDDYVEPDWQVVTSGYFEALGIELREGRFLDDGDRAGGRLVAVVSEAMARRYWPRESALGRRFHLGTADQPWVEIVGVAASVRQNDVLEAPRIEVYLPHEQFPEIQGGGGAQRTMGLAIRTTENPLGVVPAVRRELAALDGSIPLADPIRMSTVTGNAIAEQRFTAELFGLFAALALALAVVGLYGVTSYSTARRTNEIGIRMTLGAGALDVARLVVREALVVAGAGVLAGSIAALWLTRFLTGQLYGVSRIDPATFVLVPLVLLLVAGIAAYLPARRAARIDPTLALRSTG